MAPLPSGVRSLPVSVLDPAVGDSVGIAVGLTTSSTPPTSLASCAVAGSVTTAQTVVNPATALNFTPNVNVGSNGTYYGWVFIFINGQPYGIVAVSGTLTIGTITVTTGGWS